MEDEASRLRGLPSVNRVVEALGGSEQSDVTDLARRAVEIARTRIRAGEDLSHDAVVQIARELAAESKRSRLQRVINATGVLIHTNLGRVPLSARQLNAAVEVASGYSNLEYDLTSGTRGSRHQHGRALLRSATGAEDALVVNNNAAAVLVTVAALCGGRDVVVSRGELIEIGGEFRLPDVMVAAGTRLEEVGTTNRTHLADYERAVSEHTAAFLKVHPANFRITGFTSTVSIRDLARLARARGLPLICDLGSGLLREPAVDLSPEPIVSQALEQGADVVTFSGDKLLGGAQAGLIVGRAELIARIARHPLMRAVRVDKMTLAVLQETLIAYLDGREHELPLWQMMTASAEDLETRARALADELDRALETRGVKTGAAAMESVTGGGSIPEQTLTSWGIVVSHPEMAVDEIASSLRRAEVPVVTRIEEDRLLIDLRSVAPGDDDLLAATLIACLGER